MNSTSLAFDLKGSAVTGNWLVLESVEILSIETLAVLTQFILGIRQALDAAQGKAILWSDKLSVNKRFNCVFITKTLDF